MADRVPKQILELVFYKQQNGREPVREWLKSLPKADRRTIGEDMKTVQRGWPLGMPLVRSLGKGLWEVRSTLVNTIGRVFFILYEGKMVLLYGFIKKTQETPSQNIEIARKRAKEVWREA